MLDPEAEGRSDSYTQFRNRYHQVLDLYLPAAIKSRKDVVRVFSVGCGFGLEALGVQQIIPTAHYEGIDSDPKAIDGARKFNSQLPPERFRQADALSQSSFGDEPWDLVIIRNPRLGGMTILRNPYWGKVIANSINATKEGGFLYMTTLFELEYRRLIERLKLFPQIKVEDLPEEIPLELPKIPYEEKFALLARKLAPRA